MRRLCRVAVQGRGNLFGTPHIEKLRTSQSVSIRVGRSLNSTILQNSSQISSLFVNVLTVCISYLLAVPAKNTIVTSVSLYARDN